MSTTIDNRVVEMQFDNRHFEKNVSTTMSTLDKLKQKLHLKGATTGLENVNKAAKNVNMSGLGSAVQTVSAKFSALEVMGVTALANITNSAVNAGKRIVSALTIDPVKTGLSEYETKINAIQVIKANTRAIYEGDEARQMQDIEDALADLNTYADRTIYNFAQMTDNVGKFVAQGLGVKEAAKAVQGMANLAGASGASAQDMARATYQMSQALGGTIRKIDWNSLRNANMASVELKNTLTDLAKVKGIDIEGMIAKKGTFEDTLEEGWLTGALFTEAMNIYSDVYSEAELAAMGFNEAQIKNFKDLAKTAAEATTEVKTMSQLWDVLKETAQSGWTQTWEIIIGDFASAKRLWTDVQNYFSDIINAMSKARNDLLSSALLKGLTGIKENLTDLLKPAAKAMDTVKDATKSIAGITKTLEEHEAVVKSVINGDWGHTTERWNKLTEAGYDWVHVQNLVNEQQGSSKRRTSEYTEWLKNQTSATKDSTEATVKMEQSEAEYIATLARLSDAELRSLGYSKKQIEAFRELANMADRLGMPIEELIENIDKINGRWLLIESFKNIGKTLEGAFKTIGDAWKEIFPPKSVEERAEGIFNLIAAFHKLTRNLTKFRDEEGNLTDDGEKLVRTFKGIFAIVDLVSTIFGGAFKIAFKVASALLKYFNLDILDVTAYIGDAIVGFRDFVESMFDVGKILDKIVPPLKNAAKAVKDFLVDGFNKIPKDMISGFAIGIWNGIQDAAKAIWDFGKSMLAKLREAIDSHSPSNETKAIGKDFVSGFIVGISEWASKAFSKIKEFGKSCVDVFNKIDFGNLIALGISGASIVGIFKVAQVLNAMIAPMEALDDIGEGINKALTGVKWAMIGEAIKSFAIAIGILAASLVVLSFVNQKNMWSAVGAIVVLAGVMSGLVFALSRFDIGETKGMAKLILAIVAISAAMMLLAGALRIINKVNPETVLEVLFGVLALFVTIGIIANTPGAKKIGSFGFILAKLGAALLLLSVTLWIIGSMPEGKYEAGLLGIIGLLSLIVVFIGTLQVIGKGNVLKGVDKTLFSVAGVMLIMTIVAKMIANMTWQEALQGGLGIVAFAGIIVGIVYALKPLEKGQSLKGVGTTLFGIAAAMMVMAMVMKILGGMDTGKAIKGTVGVVALAGAIVALLYALKPLEKDQSLKRVGRTLLMMSVAIGVLALVATLLGFVSIDNLAKGITAVGLISLMMMGLVKSTRGATSMTGTIVTITIAIAILVAAVAGLGLIDPTKLAAGTLAVSTILGMFALVLKMGGIVQKSWPTLLILTAAIAILAAILYFLAKLPVETTLGIAKSLSMLLLSLAASFALLAVAGLAGTAAAAGLAVMTGVIVAIGAIVIAIGALMDNFPVLEEFLDKGLGVLEKIGLGLGKALGAFVAGFTTAVAATLPIIGMALSKFMVNALPFITGVRTVDSKVLKGTGYLAAAIALLGAADYIAGIGSIIGSGFGELGAELSEFMKGAGGFIEGIKNVDPASMHGVKALSEAILILTGTDFLNAIASKFIGESSFADFGPQLKILGEGIMSYGRSVVGIDLYSKYIEASIPALKSLVDIANALPNSGGWLGKIVGNNDMDDFGDQLEGLGNGLMKYARSIVGIDKYANYIEASIPAAKSLVELAKTIPNSGGILGFLAGNNDLDAFGTKLKAFGEGLINYGRSVSSIDIYGKYIEASVPAAQGLVDLANTLPKQGGIVELFTGWSDMEEFGSQLESFGLSLMTYGRSIVGIDAYTKYIEASIPAAKGMAGVAKEAKSIGKWDVGKSEFVKFGENLATFGSCMSAYGQSVSNINVTQLSGVTDEISELADVASKVSGVDSYGFSAFGDALANLAVDGINKFINAFNGSVAKVRATVNNFIATASAAVLLGKTALGNAMGTAVDGALSAIAAKRPAFYTAGMQLVTGFASGISVNSYIATAASRAMARAAADAAEDELDINSPSKIFRAIGYSVPEGFANGIDKLRRLVTGSSTKMADAAVGTVSNAVSRLSDMVNSDIDTQPTIRPVLDLSDVRAGVGTIGSLFGDSPVGVFANVGSISAGMSRYNQNGMNDDVVSAIKDLKKALGNTGDTYQINGVTYDDGSNIAEAVKSLVHAAKVGRRV